LAKCNLVFIKKKSSGTDFLDFKAFLQRVIRVIRAERHLFTMLGQN
jgi:hypothetical protein